MAQMSRRGLLLSGGLALGVAAAGGPFTASAAFAVSYDPSYGTAHLYQYGNPAPFKTLTSLSNSAVMQDVVYVPSTGTLFVSQALNGSNGTSSPYGTMLINRVRYSDGAVLDSMQLVDGGHGLGFEVEMLDGQAMIWMTWQGKSADSGWRENDVVRFKYFAGTWQRGTVNNEFGLQVLPLQDRQQNSPEAVYHFDRAKDWAVERHFHYPLGSEAPSETYKRRHISDLWMNVDRTYGDITLSATPPTTQGFATINDTLFRWLGAPISNNTTNSADPVKIEQYNWNTGQLIASKTYDTIARGSDNTWRDGIFEPQGMSIFRESNNTASLVVGNTTGRPTNHVYYISKFESIGAV